jgi:hypothetical protein
MLTVTSDKIDIGVTHDCNGQRYACECAECGRRNHFINMTTSRNQLFCGVMCSEAEGKRKSDPVAIEPKTDDNVAVNFKALLSCDNTEAQERHRAGFVERRESRKKTDKVKSKATRWTKANDDFEYNL